MTDRQTLARRALYWLAWLVLATLVAACSPRATEPGGGAATDDLEGSEWVLVEIDGRPALAGVQATIRFGEGNELSGSAGCNTYGGVYDADPAAARITTDRLFQTEMACLTPAGAMEQEQAYMGALRDAATYRVEEERLEIQDGTGTTRLVYRPDAPLTVDPALLGSEWVLTSLGDATPIEDTRVLLAFQADGASGFAGCNNYGAEYESADGGALRLGEIASQLQACQAPVMAQETTYLGALPTVAGYRIEGDTLVLLDPSGQTLMALTRRTTEAMDPALLAGTRWQVSTMGKSSPIPGSTITLVFRDAHGFAGHGGCRGYVGGYAAEGARLGLRWLAMLGTEACGARADLIEQDQRYGTLIEGARTYRLESESLEIETASGEVLTFRPLPAEADAPLLGTAWTLIAMLEPGAPDAEGPAQWMPVDLVPSTTVTAEWDEERVSGSAGCNTYRATYSAEGTDLTVGPAMATRMVCSAPDGVMAQEQGFLAQLSASTHYRIDGPQLWLEGSEGQALLFVASEATE